MKATAPGVASPSRTAVGESNQHGQVTIGNKSLYKCSTPVLTIPPEFSLHNPLPLGPLYQSPLPSLNFMRCLASSYHPRHWSPPYIGFLSVLQGFSFISGLFFFYSSPSLMRIIFPVQMQIPWSS